MSAGHNRFSGMSNFKLKSWRSNVFVSVRRDEGDAKSTVLFRFFESEEQEVVVVEEEEEVVESAGTYTAAKSGYSAANSSKLGALL